MTITPYGDVLVNRVVPGREATEARGRASTLPQIGISSSTSSDLYLIAVGGLSPLTGFMNRDEYSTVLERMTLLNGLPWSVPVTLPATRREAGPLAAEMEVALIGDDGETAALLHVEDTFEWDRNREAEAVYGTTDCDHPGVARLDAPGDLLIAGSVRHLLDGDISDFPDRHLTPAETREAFERRDWRTVAAFQTRNPVHRAHEYLQKCAMEITDGLLLRPLVGDTKDDDVPADVRMECYEVVFKRYYPKGRVILWVLPATMRYAGPKEAVHHAITRRNYGCTHFIVGRDHAGVGDYYGTYEAQNIFDRVDPQQLGIVPLKFEHAFFCTRCDQMASAKTCPHEKLNHVILSGTRVPDMLSRGERPPAQFSRPEVADVLVQAYAGERQPLVTDGDPRL